MPEIRYIVTVDEKGAVAGINKFTGAVQSSGQKANSALGPIPSVLGNIKSLAASIGVTFGAWKVFEVIRSATGAAVDFERTMANVSTLVDTSTPQAAAQFEVLRQELLKLPPELGSSTDLAKGLYEALSAGVKPAESVKFVGDAAIFAKSALTDTRTSVDVLTSTLNAYGLSADNTGKISSAFFKAIEIGKLTGEQLASTFGRLAPITATLGVSVADASSALAVLTAGGISADEAVTALRQVLVTILQPTTQAVDAASELGLSFDDMRATLAKEDGLQKVMTQLSQVFETNGTAASQLFGNVRALVGALALTGPQAEKYRDTQIQINKAWEDGNRQNIALQKQLDTVSGKFNTLVSTVEKVILRLGIEQGLKKVLDLAIEGFDFLSEHATQLAVVIGVSLLPVVIKLIASLGLLQKAMETVQILAMVSSLGDLGAASLLIVPRFEKVAVGLSSLGARLSAVAGRAAALSASLAAINVSSIVTALGVLVGTLRTAGISLAAVAGSTVALEAAIVLAGVALANWLGDLPGLLAGLKAFAGAVADLGLALARDLGDKIASAEILIQEFARSVGDLISASFQPLLAILSDVGAAIESGLDFLGLSAAIRGVQAAINGLIDTFGDLISLFPDLAQFRDFFADLAQSTGFLNLADQIRSFKTASEIVGDATETLRAGLFKSIDALEKQNQAVGGAALDFDKLREAARTADQQGLSQLSLAVVKTSEALRGVIPVAQSVDKQLNETSSTVRKLTDDEKKLIEAFEDSLRPADKLAKEITLLSSQGKSDTDIIRVYRKEILEAVEAQRLHGLAIPPVIDSLEKEARLVEILSDKLQNDLERSLAAQTREAKAAQVAHEGLVEIDKKLLNGTLLLRLQLDQSRQSWENYNATAKGTAELLDRLIDPALVKVASTTSDVQDTTEEFGKAVSTVFTNMVQGIADALINWKNFGQSMISIAKEFGKGLLSTFLEEFFKPLQDLMQQAARSFSRLLTGSGGAGGEAGGLSGILGSFSTLGGLALSGGLAAIAGATQTQNPAARGALGFLGGGLTGLSIGGSSLLAGTSLGAFAGPIGALAGLAIGVGSSLIGRGRKEADKIVPTQNEVTAAFGKIIDEVNALRDAGNLTSADLDKAIQNITDIGTEFFQFASQFGRAGPGAIRTIQKLMSDVIASFEDSRLGAIDQELLSLREALGPLLQQQLASLDQQIAESTQKLTDYNAELQDVNSTIESLNTRILEVQLNSLQNEFDASQSSIQSYQSEIDQINSELGFAIPAHRSYAEAIRDAAAESQRAAAAVASTQGQIANLERQVQVDRLQAIIDSSRSGSAAEKAAQAQLDALRKQFAAEDRAARQEELARLKEQLPALQAAAEAAAEAEEAARRAGADRVNQLNDLIFKEQNHSSSLQEQINALKELLPAQKSELDSLQDALQAAVDRKAALEELITTETENLVALSDHRDAIASEIESLQLLLPERVSEIDAIQQTIDLINERVAALQAERDALTGGTGAGDTGIGPTNIENLPHFARGGIVTMPTLAVVGEVPERITPLSQDRSQPQSVEVNIHLSTEIRTPDVSSTRRYVREEMIPEVLDAIDNNFAGSRTRLRKRIGVG